MTMKTALAACSLVVLAAFSAIEQRRLRWPAGRLWVLWLFTLGQAGLIGCLFWYELRFELPTALFAGTLGAVALCCAANALLFRALREAEDEGLAKARVAALEQQTAAQRAYAERLDGEAAHVAQVRERIAAELAEARELLEREDAAGASERLRATAGVMRPRSRSWCDHRLLDALLSSKLEGCDERGIRVTCEADVPDDVLLPSVDVCAVLANLLDNALQACELVPEGERFVAVRAQVRAGCLVLAVENSCDASAREASQRRGRGFSRHGWGLSIVEAIVGRSDGSFDITCENAMFKAAVVLPLPPSQSQSQSQS